ncbi:MAG TPA: 4-hydroxy-tetrahydrodipicolinate reductase [Propioniciclava sp.]|jgi:4-hydroxy-tetrahydrodipicolinate reductase|uniref:4-hydroxy-tetrahydrodipicolinate reductase n=1 Tax=Propioniciclava sp. TaxID=2038686 RepID=UPI002D04F57B|nr:4-hydroxy-tetrahydrodipicolinate reductase [Propioniciclava sp.]HRL79684.1 4-hydroxy-tetrahydrodipicolinate reductase [Propioniciclava sp.]
MLRVAVLGAKGRMGAEVCRAVEAADDLELAAALDAGDDLAAASGADVVVDFTVPDAVMGNLEWCAAHGVHAVVGTTGFTPEKLARVADLFDGTKAHAIIASNYSLGSLLMMRFAEMAAPYFESVEIIEAHHPHKVDAPSGTAVTTAGRIAAARTRAGLGATPDATTTEIPGARGARVDGIAVHAVRQRGLFANQEVRFGNEGEQLVIAENGFDRSSYMPGVLTAIRGVGERPGLTLGIEELLGW